MHDEHHESEEKRKRKLRKKAAELTDDDLDGVAGGIGDEMPDSQRDRPPRRSGGAPPTVRRDSLDR